MRKKYDPKTKKTKYVETGREAKSDAKGDNPGGCCDTGRGR